MGYAIYEQPVEKVKYYTLTIDNDKIIEPCDWEILPFTLDGKNQAVIGIQDMESDLHESFLKAKLIIAKYGSQKLFTLSNVSPIIEATKDTRYIDVTFKGDITWG